MKKLSKHGFSSCKLDLWEDTNWDPEKRTFFLNEIECRRKQNTHAKFSTESRMIGRYGGTTYFIRHLKEDFVPKTLGCNGKWEAKRWERSGMNACSVHLSSVCQDISVLFHSSFSINHVLRCSSSYAENKLEQTFINPTQFFSEFMTSSTFPLAFWQVG